MNATRDGGRTRSVKVLVAESWETDARQEVARFSSIDEAVRFSKHLIDLFLTTHRSIGSNGQDLYRRFIKFGPDVEVDAALGKPVFQGWEYARQQCLGGYSMVPLI